MSVSNIALELGVAEAIVDGIINQLKGRKTTQG